MRRTFVLALLSAIALSTAANAQSNANVTDASLLDDVDRFSVWRSTSGNPDRVALEVSSLLLALDQAGALPTETIVDTVGRTMEQVMRDESRFVGAYFPLMLDRYLCSLNSHVCQTTGPSSPGVWTNVAGDELTLPALTFTEFLEFGSQQKPAGTSLLELINVGVNECTPFGMSCAEAVEQLNLHNPAAFVDAAATHVIVPQTGYRTEFDWSPFNPATGTSVAVSGLDDEARSLIKTFVEPNIVAVGAGIPQSSYAGEPAYKDQREMFSLIAFPFSDYADAEDIPAEFRDPVKIAVVDTWLDREHCDLGDHISISPPFADTNPPAGPLQDRACGERAAVANQAMDHATHVVGLIGARLDGNGTGGLNPFAQIIFRELNLNSLRNASYREALAVNLVRDSLRNDVDVFNLSWRYFNEFGARDLLEVSLTESLAGALVVVAAGNDGSTFRFGNCVALPACLAHSPNIITVVGIDRQAEQPRLWRSGAQGSNSSTDFHVGAIAADVVSTVSNDRYGAMSGTSQAAPQVTATAAYLISAHRHHFGNRPVPPIRIKNRIIYTSDIFPRLFDESLGGRLNMRRALAISNDHIIVQLETGTTAFDGTLAGVDGGPNDQSILCRDGETRSEIYIPIDDLYRFYQTDIHRYVVFARSIHDDPDSDIKRIANCELRTQSRLAEFITTTGERKTFRLDQIRDFVSAME